MKSAPLPMLRARDGTTFEGHVDALGPDMIAGWARRIGVGETPVEVDIYVDTHFFSRTIANLFSPGLKKAGIGSGYHAFAVRAPIALFDGKPHQIDARVAGTDFNLHQSPKDVTLPSILRVGPILASALVTEPWTIDAVSLHGTHLVLGGWAIPPRSRPDDVVFSIDGCAFDSVEWPLPRHDIHQIYFYHPHASRTGFALRADLSRFLRGGATEILMRFGRHSDGSPLSPFQDYYLPLSAAPVPLPEPWRRKRVSGTIDPHLFELGGYTLLRKIDNLLATRYSTSTVETAPILDWGCGCGRLLRFLTERGPAGIIFGADIDVDNIAWCAANLASSTVKVAPLLPPLPFPASQFGLIIGNSVFTHLAESVQLAWLAELHRVLRTDGLALVSVQTITDLPRETFYAPSFDRLLAEGFISDTLDDALAGVVSDPGYYRAAYHTHEYITSVWSNYFCIEDIVPQFSNNMQDLVVMRKKSGR